MRYNSLILLLVFLLFKPAGGLCALPDLRPVALQFPTNIVTEPNSAVTFICTVTNQGNSASWPRWDGVYFSTNAEINANNSPLSTWYIYDSIQPGQSALETNLVTLPFAPSGNYYLIFKADIYDSQTELNESNNTMAVQFYYKSLAPDLAVLTLQVAEPLTVPPNPVLTLIWAVTNQGPGAAQGNWLDAIYFSTNAVLPPDAGWLGAFQGPSRLSAGEVYWQTNSVRLPVVNSGRYYLFLRSDVYNNLYDTNRGDNMLSVVLDVDVKPPDLAPLSLTAPATVTDLAYPIVTVSWAVTNQGLGDALGYWRDQLFLSKDAVLDEQVDPLITYYYRSGPIVAGDSYLQTLDIQLPVTQSGSWYLILRTDAQNELFEANYSNNIAVTPISLTIQQPDLVPLSFRAPNVFTNTPNPVLTLSWAVTNQGNGRANRGWSDAVFLSTDAQLDEHDTLIAGFSEYNTVDPGASYSRTNAIQVPITQSGSYFLIFVTDSSNSIYESDTNNNLLLTPLTCTILPPNLAPIALQAPNNLTVSPAPTMQIVWAVTNQGPGAATGYWYDQLYFSTDAQWDTSDTILASTYESGPLNPGATYWRTNTVRLPVTQSGTYYLIFTANIQRAGSPLFESDYSDNTKIVPITLTVQRPDLLPITSSLPPLITGPPFPTVTLVWGITNQGPGEASGTSWDSYVLLSSSPFAQNSYSVLVNGYITDRIGPGEVLWQTNAVRVPLSDSGDYYFIVQVDPYHRLYETDPNNNVAAVPVSFHIEPPDLAPVMFKAPTTVKMEPYPTITLAWGVTNRGRGSAIGWPTWTDHVYISTNATFDSTATDFFAFTEQGPIDPGQSYWRTNDVRLPLSQSGTYYLFFKADAGQNLVESNRSNNVALTVLSFNSQQPDLALIGTQSPSSVTGPPYPTVTYAWGVTNRGPGTANIYQTAWLDAVALSLDDKWDWSDTQLDYPYRTDRLPAGASYWSTNTVRMPVTQSGTYFLCFNTDANQALAESDYSNNTASVPISFTILPPDLAPMALKVLNSLTSAPNPSISIVWGVTNRGIGPAVGYNYWSDELYFSTDKIWDWGDSLLASYQETGPVAAGKAYWRTNTLRLPVVQSGTYYLILRTDAYKNLIESDENNNELVIPLTLTILPPDLVPVVSVVSNSITGPPQPNVTVVWGITNQGTGSVSNESTWYSNIYLSRNARLDWSDTLAFNSFDSGPLEPGMVVWRTNSFNVPVVESGLYYLIFEVNPNYSGRLFESDYSNNLAVVPVTFQIQKPDLAPLTLQVPDTITGPPNPTVTIVWGVTNQGAGLARSTSWWPTWTDSLFLSTNATLQEGDTAFSSLFATEAVPPGEVYWQTNTVRVPVVESGTYFLILRTDDNRYLYESDYNNNDLAVPVTFTIIPPDLLPLAVKIPTVVTGGPNPKLTLTWAITNQGPGLALGQWLDQVYLSRTNTIDATAQPITSTWQDGPLAAGSNYWHTDSLRVPVPESGLYYLIFAADCGNSLYESNTSNNVLVTPVLFTILPSDLAPIALKAPPRVVGPPYPSFDIYWGITNQGPGRAFEEGGWADVVYLSSDPVLERWWDPMLTYQTERGPIEPGSAYWRSRTVQAPIISSGIYYLILETDSQNPLSEPNDTNNTLVVPIEFVIQRSDLKPVALLVPNTVNSDAGPNITVTWAVTNQGPGIAISWQDYFYFSTDQTLDSNDRFIGSHSEPGPLPAGSSSDTSRASRSERSILSVASNGCRRVVA